MVEIIDYLKKYNGFVISILTSILVLSTIWYAWITKNIIRINELRHIEKTRPYDLVSFEGVDDGLEFKIKIFLGKQQLIKQYY